MQGYIGSVVHREAAENLTPLFQPMSEGSGRWRGRRETHQTDGESLLKFRIKEVRVSVICMYYWRKYQYLLEEVISHKNLKCASLRIYLSKKNLLRFELLFMCKFWHLLPRTGSHTPGYKVRKFTIVTCFFK